jgi:hypothetical protein
MPRPTTKAELIVAATEQYGKLMSLIGGDFSFHPDIAAKGTEAHWRRDKTLRDVLVHLHEWHELFLNWAVPNSNGANKPFLPEPYTWKTYGDMNMEFWEKHQNTPYEKSVEMLGASHKNVLSLIEIFSDEELFTKKYYPWTGTSSLGSYCVSVTSSHYEWAMKKIKHHIKMSRG